MTRLESSTGTFTTAVAGQVAAGARFCGLFALPCGADTRLLAVLSNGGSLVTHEAVVGDRYPSLTPDVPAAGWYEREIRDLYGTVPVGHPRPDPLVLPLAPGARRPRPGSGDPVGRIEPDLTPLPAHLHGEGVFTIPYGPVRSGVYEAVEYLVETPGEDVAHLRTRVYHKHRGMDARFCGASINDGVLLAERYEGVASVAHAIAYCGAVEELAGAEVPRQADLVRVVHAELERVANHLDSAIRHTEGAGQAVAFARLSFHKERVQRLRARLCGSRFGRGVVVPGGVAGPLAIGPGQVRAVLAEIEDDVHGDLSLLLSTPSFVDRLRRAGVLAPDVARAMALVGPVGRGSGQGEDVRRDRPYAAYDRLGHEAARAREEGDALARQRVRGEEIATSFHLVRQALDLLEEWASPLAWHVPVEPVDGEAIGWAEGPQGEVLSLVVVEDGRLARVKQRSASFVNLAAFGSSFPRDVFTDFVFIEASFGLSIAGAAG